MFCPLKWGDVQGVAGWLEELQYQGCGYLSKVLVGNKCDMEAQRVVTTEEGEELAKALSIDSFLETSAKNSSNVEDAFLKLVEDVASRSDRQGSSPAPSRRSSPIAGSAVTLPATSEPEQSVNWGCC